MSKKALNVQDDSRSKGIQGNTSKSENKCVCLNARSIINQKTELNIRVDDIKPHIIGITESWANKDITNGSFHVKSTDFWPFFHGPPPILLKFGTLVGIV